MQKNPFCVVNPSGKQNFVRLRSEQKLFIFLKKPQFKDCNICVTGNFLKIDEFDNNNEEIFASISSKQNINFDFSFFLGEVYIVKNNKIVSSLSVATYSKNNFFRTVQPNNQVICLNSFFQLLDVLFYTVDEKVNWSFEMQSDILYLELVDFKNKLIDFDSLPYSIYCKKQDVIKECHFRFRLNLLSFHVLANLKKGFYSAGILHFFKSDNLQKTSLSVYLQNKGKFLIQNKTFLPKSLFLIDQKKPKQMMKSNVSLSKIDNENMTFGCNVVWMD